MRAYDLFGDGKTAAQGEPQQVHDRVRPPGAVGRCEQSGAAQRRTFVTRNWTDTNLNYVPDCDVTNPLAQGPTAAGVLQTIDTCGAMSDANFGKPTVSTTVDPDILSGHRGYNWEFSAGIQHESCRASPSMSVTSGAG